ncbi:unnamed protein product, partial [Phaeothamnion confervicola]
MSSAVATEVPVGGRLPPAATAAGGAELPADVKERNRQAFLRERAEMQAKLAARQQQHPGPGAIMGTAAQAAQPGGGAFGSGGRGGGGSPYGADAGSPYATEGFGSGGSGNAAAAAATTAAVAAATAVAAERERVMEEERRRRAAAEAKEREQREEERRRHMEEERRARLKEEQRRAREREAEEARLKAEWEAQEKKRIEEEERQRQELLAAERARAEKERRKKEELMLKTRDIMSSLLFDNPEAEGGLFGAMGSGPRGGGGGGSAVKGVFDDDGSGAAFLQRDEPPAIGVGGSSAAGFGSGGGSSGGYRSGSGGRARAAGASAAGMKLFEDDVAFGGCAVADASSPAQAGRGSAQFLPGPSGGACSAASARDFRCPDSDASQFGSGLFEDDAVNVTKGVSGGGDGVRAATMAQRQSPGLKAPENRQGEGARGRRGSGEGSFAQNKFSSSVVGAFGGAGGGGYGLQPNHRAGAPPATCGVDVVKGMGVD